MHECIRGPLLSHLGIPSRYSRWGMIYKPIYHKIIREEALLGLRWRGWGKELMRSTLGQSCCMGSGLLCGCSPYQAQICRCIIPYLGVTWLVCILGSKTAVGFDSKLKNLCVATEDPSELLQRYNQKCTDTDRGQNSTWISCAVSISEVSTMYAPPSESCYKHATKHLCFQVNGVSLASHIEPFDVTSRYPISALKMGHDLQVVLYLQIWEDILPKIIMICC